MRAVFFWLAFIVAGCGNPVPNVPQIPADGVVLAFGDSLTFGTGAKPGESYPSVLEKLIHRKVENAGIPGEVSTAGLARFSSVLAEVRPQMVILCHGGNDFLRKLDEKKAAENLRAMIRLANEHGVAVALIGVPRPGLFPAPAAFYEDIASEFRIPYEPDILKSVLSDNELKSDLVHPNAMGYAKIANAVAGLLKKSGAI